jgi:hypothetical protein
MISASFRVFGNLGLRGEFEMRPAPTSITAWSTGDDPLAGGPPAWRLPHWWLDRYNDAAHLEALRRPDYEPAP